MEEIYLRGLCSEIWNSESEYRVNAISIILGIEMEKLDRNTLKTKIETSYGVGVCLVSGKLTITKV